MKLLPPKQLQSKINEQKKAEIDAGIFVARKVDALREEMLSLQKERDDFITGSQAVINYSLKELHNKKGSLEKEIKELEEKRRELLKPFDEEWGKVEKAKKEILNTKEELRLIKEKLGQESIEIGSEHEKLTKASLRIKRNEEETEKARSNTVSLQEMAQREYEIAHDEHVSQTDAYEKTMSKLSQSRTEYEVGIQTNKIKKEELDEKEADLIKREKHLASQQIALQIAYEEIKK